MYVSLSNGTVNAIKNNLVFGNTCGKKVHNGLSLYFLSFGKKIVSDLMILIWQKSIGAPKALSKFREIL